MDDTLKKCMLFPILNIVMIVFIKQIINIFDLEFMSWFYYFFCGINFIIFIVSILIHTIKSILNTNHKIKKIVLIILIIFPILTITYLVILFSSILNRPTYIVEKDNQKMEASVFYWDKSTEVTYYKYINFFIRSYKSVDLEFCSDSQNPFEDKAEYQKYLKKSLPHNLYRVITDSVGLISINIMGVIDNLWN